MGDSSSLEIRNETEKTSHESSSESSTEISSTMKVQQSIQPPKQNVPISSLKPEKPPEKLKPESPKSSFGVSCQDRNRSSTIIRTLNQMKPLNQIRRVPRHFKCKISHVCVYDPVIISLGPYNYRRTEYQHAEIFKQVSLSAFVLNSGNSNKNEDYFYNKILERIQDVRDCYEEVRWDDGTLALLMLRDACFFIYTMELSSMLTTDEVAIYYNYFGIGAMNLIGRDLLLLENQIPFWIIKLLVCSRCPQPDQGQSVWNNMLAHHMNRATSMHLETVPWGNDEPFHFLDAARYYHTMPMKALDEHNTYKTPINVTSEIYKEINYQFRSVTNLKAKGIRFRPSNSTKGKDNSISFTSHSMYGQLTLPPLIFSVNFFDMYSNFIAYEIFPTSNAKLYATAFVNFIKSLIETSNDVKILREEGILFSNIGSDEEVVQMVKDLQTFGVERSGVFLELRKSITSHCCSKSKTWVAELIHTYFRSPWTTIAVFAAVALLCSTFLQTFFTIYPKS